MIEFRTRDETRRFAEDEWSADTVSPPRRRRRGDRGHLQPRPLTDRPFDVFNCLMDLKAIHCSVLKIQINIDALDESLLSFQKSFWKLELGPV